MCYNTLPPAHERKSTMSKKYPEKPERIWSHTSFFISEAFRDTWKKFTELAEIDDDEGFVSYCQEIEKEDLSKKNHSKRGIYIRWILTTHVLQNLSKLPIKKS